MSVITDEERTRLLSHDLHDEIVRQALAGFLSAALKENRHVRVPPRIIMKWLDNYAFGLPEKLDVARAAFDAGYRSPSMPEDH